MRRKAISSASLLSILLSTILSLSAIYSGIGIAKADSVIATVPVGSHPVTSAFNPNNGNMYVTNQGSNSISVIDGRTNTVIGSPIPVGTSPSGIAFNPNNGNIYVTNTNIGSNTVSIIDGKTNTVIGSPHTSW
jgi:YVTN family beta-propeller protein